MYFLFFNRDDLLSYLTNHNNVLWKLFLKLCTNLKITCDGRDLTKIKLRVKPSKR